MLTNTWNENAESNAKVPQESDTECTTENAQQRLRPALLCSCYRISYCPCSVKIRKQQKDHQSLLLLSLTKAIAIVLDRLTMKLAQAIHLRKVQKTRRMHPPKPWTRKKWYKFIRPKELLIEGFPVRFIFLCRFTCLYKGRSVFDIFGSQASGIRFGEKFTYLPSSCSITDEISQ